MALASDLSIILPCYCASSVENSCSLKCGQMIMRLRTVVVPLALLIVVSIYRMISRDGYEAGVATQPAIDLLKSSLKRVEARERTYATNSFDGSSGPTVSSVSSVDEQGGNRGALLYSGLDGEKNVEEVSTPGAEPSALPVNHGYEQDVLSPNPLIFSNRSFSVEYLKDQLVYVTAISNNHFTGHVSINRTLYSKHVVYCF